MKPNKVINLKRGPDKSSLIREIVAKIPKENQNVQIMCGNGGN